MRKDLVQGLIDYMNGDHWRDFLNVLYDPDRRIWHAHIYVETCIHPDAFNEIVEGYFKKTGNELMRSIDFLLGKPENKFCALHNVHPKGQPHFDLFYYYNPDVAMIPADLSKEGYGEVGKNALHWGRPEMDEFYKQFDFKAIGPQEEAEIREFFFSRHWKEFLKKVIDPDVIHVHCNLQINFDPKILELIAMDSLKEMGWVVDKVVPNIFKVGDGYRGKLVFLGKSPERVYDIGWIYNEETLIAPSYEPWGRLDVEPGFDLCFNSECKHWIDSRPLVQMTKEEIAAVIEGIEA